jgi:hypothetical protein
MRILIGLAAVDEPRKNIRILDHALPDTFDLDEEIERRAARSLATRHRTLFLPAKKYPRF